ncbi:MAG: 50S ribosomal protein L6, partial [Alphaproteobacteria bacterium]|nr:50S ribosomal protein L6 [Alphaproteobacteria bacterium]
MSRVGKYPVTVPNGVTVTIADGLLTVKGKMGALTLPLRDEVEASIDGDKVWVKPRSETKFARSMWGTTRANIRNMVVGVGDGFSRKLDLVGVGYKA